MRKKIITMAVTLLLLGLQTASASFVLGLLGLRRR